MKLDKWKQKTLNNKKMIWFLFGLAIMAIISGSLFITMITKSDQTLVKQYIESFMDSIISSKVDYFGVLKNTLFNNLLFIIAIWLLGISVIGIPISIFMYFSKLFMLGFSVSSFMLTYKGKGILYSIFYIFPHHIMNIILYTLLTIYTLKMSHTLLRSIIEKKEINIKKKMNRYLLVLGICIIGVIITSLYEVFVIPFIFDKLKFLIK